MKNFNLLKISLIIPFLMCSCGEKEVIVKHLEFKENDTKIMIVSDTHYLASSLLDPTRDYDSEDFVNDGRTLNYNNRLFDELLNKVKEELPDYFIITGDLSYNGAKLSHEELSSKLNSLNELGIKPLVIPGNHDTFIMHSYDYSTTDYNLTSGTTIEEFKSIYKDAGYEGAHSYQEDSLSYSYITKNNEMLLMLDTTLNRFNVEYQYDFIGGSLEGQLDWIKGELEYAKNNNMEVISFTHHNLINHNPMFTDKYDINNRQEVRDLFNEYNVKVNFSGHLHVQDIQYYDNIYDVCSNSLLDFGNRYGVFNIGEVGKEYNAYNLDFKLDETTSYSEYSYNLFKKKYMMKSRYEMEDENKLKLLKEYASMLNAYYFDGSLYLHKDLKKQKEYRWLKKQNNKYSSYLLTLFNQNNHHFDIENE